MVGSIMSDEANVLGADATTVADLTEKQRRILEYLSANVDGRSYFKSRLIGQELGLSAKEVGSNMAAITAGEFGIDVAKWGFSSSTTWEVVD